MKRVAWALDRNAALIKIAERLSAEAEELRQANRVTDAQTLDSLAEQVNAVRLGLFTMHG